MLKWIDKLKPLRTSGRRNRRAGHRRTRGKRVLAAEQLERRALLAVVIDLGEMDPADGFELNSAVPQDRAGLSVSGAGDVNGDGFDDLLVGAPVDAGFPAGTGQAYLVHGRQDGFGDALNLFELTGDGGTTIFGTSAEDHAGFSVSGAGDLNGDGFHDYLIGAPAADRVTSSGLLVGAGQAYAIFGGTDPPPQLVAELTGDNGFQLVGNAPFDRLGFSVGSAGDVNGDGYDDLIVGAPAAPVQFPFVEGTGQAYLVYGSGDEFPPSLLASLLAGPEGGQMIGLNLGDRTGYAVAGVGDLNGDGFDDLVIGSPYADRLEAGNPLFGSGASYVVFGGFDALPGLADLDGTNGFRLEGLRPFDRSGFAVSSAGDVNGDGLDDLLIGAPADLDVPVTPGEAYVVFGRAEAYPVQINLGLIDGSDGFVIQGIAGLDHAGFSVSSAGDVNSDGLDDLIIGAPFADRQPSVGNLLFGSGESYVVFGRSSDFPDRLLLGTLSDSDGLLLQGDAAFDHSGLSVSSAGDINGDGFDDMLIGAPSDFQNSFRPGRAYAVFGRDFTGTNPLTGDAEDNTLSGDATANHILGGVGDDLLRGAGGEDVLRGGQGDDLLEITDLLFQRLDGGRGSDTLRLAGEGLHLDLTTIPDNRLTEIEAIDISGSGDNQLTIGNVREVLNISETSNRLVVYRDGGDIVDRGDGWSATGTETIDGIDFRRFTLGAAELLVENLPPEVDLNGDAVGTGFAAAYVEDAEPVPIVSPNLVVSDDDPIVSARAVLINRVEGDAESLFLVTGFGISASYDPASVAWELTGSASAAEYAEVLQSLSYENASQSPDESNRLVEIYVSDGLDESLPAVATITVTAVNDAPVLDPLPEPLLSPIAEDQLNSAGDAVADIVIDGSVTDPDGAAVEAIAVVAADESHGRWQYALAGGEWMDLDGPVESAARLLSAQDRIRFLPMVDFHGAATIGFRAWDQSSGAAGGVADVSVNGGTTAFSAAFDTATLTVTPVNDAPVLDADADPVLTRVFINEVDPAGDRVSAIVVDGSITDPDGPAVEAIAIVEVDTSNGRWEYSLDGVSWDPISGSDEAALLLGPDSWIRFVPQADYAGSATLTFRAWDRTSGTEGGFADTTENGTTTAFSAELDTIRVDVRTDRPPTLDPVLLPIVLTADTLSHTVMLTGISDGGDGREALLVSATSSQPAILPDPVVSYVSPATAASLTLSLTGSGNGWSIVTVTVAEEDGDQISEQFAVSVGENPLIWQNPLDPFDVNGDKFVAPGDVLIVVNELNNPRYSDPVGRLILPPPTGAPPPFLDTNGDGFVAPRDVLQLINFLNRDAGSEGEGWAASRVVDELTRGSRTRRSSVWWTADSSEFWRTGLQEVLNGVAPRPPRCCSPSTRSPDGLCALCGPRPYL